MEKPLRSPPPGVASDFGKSASLALPAVATAGVCLFFVLLCAFARIYNRVLARKWTLQDYFFSFTLVSGVAFITYSIPLTIVEPFGSHVWDIDTHRLTKPWMLRFLTFAIFTGPVLWISKTMLIVHLVFFFKSIRWFKTTGYIVVVAAGLIYGLYTCIASVACSPKPDDDLESYINGFRQRTCSGTGGANMSAGILMALTNSLADFYLLMATFVLSPSMNVTLRERRVIYLMHFLGVVATISSILGLVYRIKAFQDADLTGYQIPIIVALILEVSISLMLPCLSSFYQIYRHYTYVEINERTTIGTPSTRYQSSLSQYKGPSNTHSSTPVPDPKSSWRKTHMSVEELPFRKSSMDFYRKSPLAFQDSRDSRMKRLPPTPLPMTSRNNSVAEASVRGLNTPLSPKTPKTPNSIRSMRLPVVFERR